MWKLTRGKRDRYREFLPTQMIKLLLQSGADTKIRTKHGLTAVGLAKKYGHSDMQRLLKRAVAGE